MSASVLTVRRPYRKCQETTPPIQTVAGDPRAQDAKDGGQRQIANRRAAIQAGRRTARALIGPAAQVPWGGL